MVPARRLVTDASLEPPASSALMRASRARRTSVAGGASMAVTMRPSSLGREGATVGPPYQLFVKIGLGASACSVVPAKAGTQNHRELLLSQVFASSFLIGPPRPMGPGLRQD